MKRIALGMTKRTKNQESCQSSLPERNPFKEWGLARPGTGFSAKGTRKRSSAFKESKRDKLIGFSRLNGRKSSGASARTLALQVGHTRYNEGLVTATHRLGLAAAGSGGTFCR
jgi:hypothetical protein